MAREKLMAQQRQRMEERRRRKAAEKAKPKASTPKPAAKPSKPAKPAGKPAKPSAAQDLRQGRSPDRPKPPAKPAAKPSKPTKPSKPAKPAVKTTPPGQNFFAGGKGGKYDTGVRGNPMPSNPPGQRQTRAGQHKGGERARPKTRARKIISQLRDSLKPQKKKKKN